MYKPTTLAQAADGVLSAHAAGESLDKPIADLARARKRYGRAQAEKGRTASGNRGRPVGSWHKIDPSKVRELSAGGMTAAAIAAELGCSPQTVYTALRDQPAA